MTTEQIAQRLDAKGGKFHCKAHGDDANPSGTISKGDDGVTLLHCHRGCSFEAILAAYDLKQADCFPDNTQRTASTPRKIVATYSYNDASGKLLFECVRYEPKDFKQRQPDGNGWKWNLQGVELVLFRLPEILRDVQRGLPIIVCEGEKDALVLVAAGFSATCNPMGAGKWRESYGDTLRGADCVVIPDNDSAEKKFAGQNHAAKVADNLRGKAARVRVCELPPVLNSRTVKDASDYFNAGATAADLIALIDTTATESYTPPKSETLPESSTPGRLTLRSPDEILAMQFDDSDIYLAERLLADGQPLVIAAQGGAGKSRLALQLVAAIVSGRDFVGITTGKPDSRWLFLQTENSNRRLKSDLDNIRRWIGDGWEKFNAQVVIHTLENDTDGFVNLDSLENQGAIEQAIEASKPDGIIVDPLNEFSAGDLNKDADMRVTLQTISRICKKGNPLRAIVVLHHALTGRGGAAKATGYDRASFARNSKALHAWTRGQINIAPVDPDANDRLAVACGKCSNGKEFDAFAVKLNPDTFIYERDNSVDLGAWQADMTGKAEAPDLSPDMVAGIVADLGKVNGAPKKPQIVKALRDETGCATSGAYKAIERAERAKKIHYTKTTKTYVAK